MKEKQNKELPIVLRISERKREGPMKSVLMTFQTAPINIGGIE